MMFNHPGHNLPPKVPCWIEGHILAVAMMNIHGCLDGSKQTIATRTLSLQKKGSTSGNVTSSHTQYTAMCQAMQPVPTHIKYSNTTSRQPVCDQLPFQPHRLEKFTIRLKLIGWNTPLYNLTKNTNTFPLFVEIDGVEHSTI